MKTIVLFAAICIIFAAGCLIMKHIDRFMEKNDRKIGGCKKESCSIVVGIDRFFRPDFLKEAEKYYAEARPYATIVICREKADELYCRLQERTVDIILLESSHMKPYQFYVDQGIKQEKIEGKDAKQFYILWKNGVQPEECDCFRTALKKGNRSLKNGYCDYMD